MCRCAALLVVVLAAPGPALAQSVVAPAAGATAAQAPADPAELEHIKRSLETATPLRDAVVEAPPTFRVSVSQEGVDIRTFWGEPDAVGAGVHAPGGPWHHEFHNMVVPDEFRGWGYTNILDNGEMANVAANSMALMLAMKYVPAAIGAVRKGHNRRMAKEDVRRELATFYALHPEARPVTLP
jgi:hypothetical protein